MRLSARNILKGTFKQVIHGAVDTEVIIEVSPGVEIASIITKNSAESLGLKVGSQAYAIIKAPNVIIGVD
jgi:molybdopterin-binding protein